MFRFRKQKQSKPDINDNILQIQDLFVPDGLGEYPDRAIIGPAVHSRSFVISVWPRDIMISWLDEIFSAGDIDMAVYVEPVPDREVIKRLTEKVVSAEAQYIIERQRGSITRLPELRGVIRDLETIREAIQANAERMFYVTCIITVYARSEDELNERCDVVEGILARRSTYLRCLMFEQVKALKSVIPVGNLVINNRRRNLTTGGVAAMMPVAGGELSHPSGAYWGYTIPGKNPVLYDPFVGPPYLPNPHLAVFGFTGAGKSQSLKILIGRLSLLGARFIVIDHEGEYREAVKNLYDGVVIGIEAGRPAGVNPLEIEAETRDDSRVVDIHDKVADIRALISVCVQNFANRPMNAREISILEEVVREEYASRGINADPDSLLEPGGKMLPDGAFAIGSTRKPMPTLSNICRRLQKRTGMEDLTIILNPFLKDGSLGMFDCETQHDLTAPVISFDLSRIKDEFTKLYAMFVVLTWAWQKFALKKDGGSKMVCVDEAWMFMKWPESAKFLETLARRGRKHDTGLIVASQHIEEFISREEGRAVISSCASRLLLAQSPTIVDQVVDVFHLPSGVREMLQTFAPGEGLLTLNNNTTRMQVETLGHEWPYVRTGGN